MQEKVNIEIDKELYDNIQLLKQVIPQENWQQMDDNDILRLVVWTFMAFALQEDDESEHDHGWWCWCGTGCWCH